MMKGNNNNFNFNQDQATGQRTQKNNDVSITY